MKYLALLAATILVGVTTVACTEDGYYSGRSQYGYNNPRHDRDGDGVPNYRDRRPDNPYRS